MPLFNFQFSIFNLKIPIFFIIFALCSPASKAQSVAADSAAAVNCQLSTSVAQGATEHRWLFGCGAENLLDTYLSPYEYRGVSHGALHRSERPAHWGGGRVQTLMQMCSNFSFAHSPTEDGKEIYVQLTLGGGFGYTWTLRPHLRLLAGGLLEASGGFTYNTRNGNNPAQGRLAIGLTPTAALDYAFTLKRRRLNWRTQVDLPLVGAMFSPNYGQSYYEIFSLGHYDHNIRLTTPFNCPSLRLLTTLDVPLRRVTLSLGYHADVRQADVNSLKWHAWSHQLVVGFVRRVKKLKIEN